MIMMMIFHQNVIDVGMKKLKKEKLNIIMMSMIMIPVSDHQKEVIKQEKVTNVVILQHRLTFD